MTNTPFSSMVGVAATALVLGYTAVGEPIPPEQYDYDSKETAQQYPDQYDYSVLARTDYVSIIDKIEILCEFSRSILDNIKDIEPEYSALVDEEFWDLL